MNNYTIYCTPEQAQKALELGAPIEQNTSWTDGEVPKGYCLYGEIIYEDYISCGKGIILLIPTTEQMCEWLRREKGLFVEPYLNGECSYSFSPIISTKEDGEIIHLEAVDSYEEATLVAIDAALEYLANKQE